MLVADEAIASARARMPQRTVLTAHTHAGAAGRARPGVCQEARRRSRGRHRSDGREALPPPPGSLRAPCNDFCRHVAWWGCCGGGRAGSLAVSRCCSACTSYCAHPTSTEHALLSGRRSGGNRRSARRGRQRRRRRRPRLSPRPRARRARRRRGRPLRRGLPPRLPPWPSSRPPQTAWLPPKRTSACSLLSGVSLPGAPKAWVTPFAGRPAARCQMNLRMLGKTGQKWHVAPSPARYWRTGLQRTTHALSL